jgi:FkbM family methyltransferase
MRERTPEFLAAQDRVKVGHFTRQGFDLQGVIHVGANDGEEIEYYLALGAPYVVAFEPINDAYQFLTHKWTGYGALRPYNVVVMPYALGDENKDGVICITAGDGKGSSLLKELDSPYRIEKTQRVVVRRFDSFPFALDGFNTLVVDVQGMELDVLKGFGRKLNKFSFINIECSEKVQYEGGVDAATVVQYLDSMGFQQDSPIVSHDDVMFIRKGLK